MLGEHLENIAPKYNSHLATHKLSIIDNGVLAHQIPGGMISNLTGQLKEMNALDRLGEIYKEVVQTRKDMGYPPLVTPVSQIIGAQAVLECAFWPLCKSIQPAQRFGFGLVRQNPDAD